MLPFILIYLHNVRGISLGTAGPHRRDERVRAASSPGRSCGTLVDRVGGRRMLAVALVFLAAGFGLYPFVHEPWLAFVAAARDRRSGTAASGPRSRR